MGPTVLVTRKLPPAVEERLRRDYRPTLNADDHQLTPDELAAAAQDADALLVTPRERIDADLISRLPNRVRIIATYSVGHEHIDKPAARERGIVVTNVPDVLTEATAEIAMLLLLGAARRASEAEALLRRGGWPGWSAMFMLGVQLDGKTLGIVGMGRIGQSLARRARAFGMTVHYHNRRRLAPDLEHGAVFHDRLEDLLPLAQFLSLNCPSTPETQGMLNTPRIELLPPGAIVVNTARGDLVDDDALIAALRSGRLRAAGLDVFAGEPRLHPGYLGLTNAMLLPHIGSATIETRDAMGFRALDNLDAVFAGTPPLDRLA